MDTIDETIEHLEKSIERVTKRIEELESVQEKLYEAKRILEDGDEDQDNDNVEKDEKHKTIDEDNRDTSTKLDQPLKAPRENDSYDDDHEIDLMDDFQWHGMTPEMKLAFLNSDLDAYNSMRRFGFVF